MRGSMFDSSKGQGFRNESEEEERREGNGNGSLRERDTGKSNERFDIEEALDFYRSVTRVFCCCKFYDTWH